MSRNRLNPQYLCAQSNRFCNTFWLSDPGSTFLVNYYINPSFQAAYPIDTVKRRMMMTSGEKIKYNGSIDCFRQVSTSSFCRQCNLCKQWRSWSVSYRAVISTHTMSSARSKINFQLMTNRCLLWTTRLSVSFFYEPTFCFTKSWRRDSLSQSGCLQRNRLFEASLGPLGSSAITLNECFTMSLCDDLFKVINNEGPKALFRGAGVNVVRGVAGAGVLSGIEFKTSWES